MAKSSVPAKNLQVKRAYEPAESGDGMRILVERLWPRGVSKEEAALDDWLKELAPSTELRKWFGHDPERWQEFQKRYRAELKEHEEALQNLRDIIRKKRVTLIYSTRDEEHNGVIVLRKVLMEV